MHDQITATIAYLRADPLMLLLAMSALALVGFAVLVGVMLRQGSVRAGYEALRQAQARAAETELSELKIRLSIMTEITAERQSELARSVNERLDRVTQHLGASVEETGRRTTENLSRLHERLAVIDTAQKNITELSGRVVTLQDILANKQSRGAFGQLRMEAIIEDGLPTGAYSFEATLSNGKRPDCLIHLPHSPAGIVIDSKFPLEAFEALRRARSEDDRKDACRRIRIDVGRHIDDVATKYLIAGETQETAMLFIPSESVYAELNEAFPDMVQKAYRARIIIVSPNMLMLAVQTMMTIMKDVRMREQTHIIRREVGSLLDDMKKLRERVLDLQKHYGQLGPDIEKILVSTDKISSRGRRIEGLDLNESALAETAPCLAAE